MLLGKSTNVCMTLVHSKIIAEMDIVAPEHPCSVAWMTPGIAKCSSKQLKLYKKYLTSGNETDRLKYKEYRDVLKGIKRRRKTSYFVDKCTEFRNNSKKLWNMINRIIGKTPNKTSII